MTVPLQRGQTNPTEISEALCLGNFSFPASLRQAGVGQVGHFRWGLCPAPAAEKNLFAKSPCALFPAPAQISQLGHISAAGCPDAPATMTVF